MGNRAFLQVEESLNNIAGVDMEKNKFCVLSQPNQGREVNLQEPVDMYSQKNLMHQHFLFVAFNSFYGLKQAPKVWFEKLRTTNFTSGLKQSHSDHSTFFRHIYSGHRSFSLQE